MSKSDEPRTVQFLLEGPCPHWGGMENWPSDLPNPPFPIWVFYPAKKCDGSLCGAKLAYRVAGGVPSGHIGFLACEHMGHLIE